MMIRRIRNQLFKELEQFVRDRLGVALAFILPVIALLIIGYAIRLEAKNIALAVRDFDRTSLSRSYIERLYATNLFVPAQWQGERFPDAIDRGTASVQVTIPPDFTAEVQAGKTGNLQVVIDGSDVINARVTRLAIQGTTLSVVQAQLGKIADSLGVISQVRLWFNPGRQESLFIVPGSYGVILAIFPPLLIAIALVREKEQGTILQLYASSISACVAADDTKQRPIMIHRAIFGSIERFFGILIENYAGDFPLWLAPIQCRLLPVSDEVREYAELVAMELHKEGLRVEVDSSGERLGKQIRNSELEKIPVVAVVGKREMENQTLSVRTRQAGDLGTLSVNETMTCLQSAIALNTTI